MNKGYIFYIKLFSLIGREATERRRREEAILSASSLCVLSSNVIVA
jgi:hypothetical protein